MRKKKNMNIIVQGVSLFIACLLISPLIYALSVSFMDSKDILKSPPSIIPSKFILDNYIKALTSTAMLQYILNSFIIAIIISVSRIVLASMSAFAFAFFEFKGKKLLFYITLATLMIPAEVLIIANYTTVSKLGLINTYLAICIIFLVDANNIFIMRQQFLSFAKSLREAALIDGCGNLKFYLKILLPVNIPVMVTVFITAFVSAWNQYLWPLIVTNKDEMRPVQVGVTMLKNWDSVDFGPVMAGSIIALLPTVIVFIFFQRRIVGGMMTGSVKE